VLEGESGRTGDVFLHDFKHLAGGGQELDGTVVNDDNLVASGWLDGADDIQVAYTVKDEVEMMRFFNKSVTDVIL
jgi:hypothetical protein